MSKKNRRRTAPRPTVVFDFGGVLSAGHDPVPDVHELLGGDIETLRQALWAERPAYDAGACTAAEYWGAVAAAVGIPAVLVATALYFTVIRRRLDQGDIDEAFAEAERMR